MTDIKTIKDLEAEVKASNKIETPETLQDALIDVSTTTKETLNSDLETELQNIQAELKKAQEEAQAKQDAAKQAHEDAMAEAIAKEKAAQAFLDNGKIIATELKNAKDGNQANSETLNNAIAALEDAGFDMRSNEIVEKLLSYKTTGIMGLGMTKAIQLRMSVSNAERIELDNKRTAAYINIQEKYTALANALTNESDPRGALNAAKNTAEAINFAVGTLKMNQSKLLDKSANELLTSLPNNDAQPAINLIASLVETNTLFTEIKTSLKDPNYANIIATNIAQIDDLIGDVTASTPFSPEDIYTASLSEHGITNQCDFDAAAKYFAHEANVERILADMSALKAPKDRAINSDEVAQLRNLDFSKGRLKAAGVQDDTLAEFEQAKGKLMSLFTSLAAGAEKTGPEAAQYVQADDPRIEEVSSEISTISIKAYADMISRQLKRRIQPV